MKFLKLLLLPLLHLRRMKKNTNKENENRYFPHFYFFTLFEVFLAIILKISNKRRRWTFLSVIYDNMKFACAKNIFCLMLG